MIFKIRFFLASAFYGIMLGLASIILILGRIAGAFEWLGDKISGGELIPK